MSVKQRTLKSEFSLNGKGLHTGKQVTATFKPAEENFGYRIRRMDLEGSPEIPALAEYVKLMDRASCACSPWSMRWQLFTGVELTTA